MGGLDALAALADDDAKALGDEIRRLLLAGDEEAPLDVKPEEEEENGSVVVRVLAHLRVRPAGTAYAVAAELVRLEENGGEQAEDDGAGAPTVVEARQRGLLSGLLELARERLEAERGGEDGEGEPGGGEQGENTNALQSMLVAYAARVATELTSRGAVEEVVPDTRRLLAAWADAVVEVAVRLPPSQDADRDAWALRLAGEFLRIHQHSPAAREDFRTMTLVWKNLNKLSAVYRAAILQHVEGDVSRDEAGRVAFSFSTVFDAAATSLARTTQRLRATALAPVDEELAAELKLLRLFLRAFQGQCVQFVDSMVAQVECSVALAVDAVAAVVPIVEGLVTQSEKLQHEAVRVLHCVISFVETMARSEKLQASTRSFVGTLLWQPRDKMDTLVTQTRSQYVDSDDGAQQSDDLLAWAHVLALATFYAVHGDSEGSPSSTQAVSSTVGATPEFECVAALLTRFRTWGSRVLVGEFSKTKSLFVDMVLDSLVAQARSTSALQLFLLEQTLHPDPTQRFLLWDFWRELLCFIWEDSVVSAMFNTLLELTYAKNGKGSMLQADARDEILNLLAYIYPELCGTVKQEYLRVVSQAFDVVCAEGPGHKLTPQLASSFDLLELLASSSLLVEYEESDKEEWIAHYLPVAMECIGGVHDFLDQGQMMAPKERDGVLRVLAGGLLVIRSIFEDNDKADDESAQGLASMVLPMCAETVTHLANMVQRSNGDQAHSSPLFSKFFTRVLATCLEILTSLSPSIKTNRSNQCVQVIKDLLTILQSNHELTPHATAIAVFIRDALGDMCVMPSDVDVVWKMLGTVFHKLSALHFGIQVDPTTQSLTPPQSVCLEAMYALMAQSNLPDIAGRQRKFNGWMVPHAQPRFAKYIQVMCEGPLVAAATKRDQCDKWCQSERFYETFYLRFPSAKRHEVEDPSSCRERDQPSETVQSEVAQLHTVSADDVDMDENAKRIKWDSFAATYWQLHDSLSALSTPELQEAFMDRLTEKDLDQATSALQELLKKSPVK